MVVNDYGVSFVDRKSERFWHIDLIECIGLLFVVIYHSTSYVFSPLGDGETFENIRYLLRTILSTCVPLFFLCNGYLLFGKSFDLKKHIRKSVNLIILTVVWGAIGLIVISTLKRDMLSIKEFASNLWNFAPTGWINHLWFMGALICIYVFFPLLKTTYDTHKEIFIFFTILTFILTIGNAVISDVLKLIIKISDKQNRYSNIDIFYYWNIFNMFNPFRQLHGFSFTYFCIGGLLKDHEQKIREWKYKNIISVVAIMISCVLMYIFAVFCSRTKNSAYDVVFNGYSTIFTFVNVLAIYTLCIGYKGKMKIVELISCNTLGIFFMHNILIQLTYGYFTKVSFFCTFIGNVTYAVILILICLFVTLVIKKIPILKRLI